MWLTNKISQVRVHQLAGREGADRGRDRAYSSHRQAFYAVLLFCVNMMNAS